MKKTLKIILFFFIIVLILFGFFNFVIFVDYYDKKKIQEQENKINNTIFNIEKSISKKDAIKDINFLKIIIEQFHPEPFVFRPKEYVDAIYKEKIKQIKEYPNKNLSIVDFAQIVEEIVYSYKDYHMSLVHNYEKNYFYKKKMFPFNLFIDYQKNVYILEPFDSDNAKYNGSKIISINGTNIEDIVNKLENRTKIYSKNSSYFLLSKDYNFSKYLFIIWGEIEDYTIELKEYKTKEIKKINIKGEVLDYKKKTPTIYNFSNFEKIEENLKDFEFYIDKKNKIAIIKIYCFPLNFKISKLQSFIEKIDKNNINDIIIDNRDNKGGDGSLARSLLRFFVDFDYRVFYSTFNVIKETKPKIIFVTQYYSFFQYERFIIKNILNTIFLNNNFNNKINTEDYVYYQGYIFINNKQISPFIDNNEENLVNIPKKRLFILQGPETFSAGSIISYYIKKYNLGYLIGENSASMNIETGGDLYKFHLPYSKFFIYIPTRIFSYDKNQSELHPLPLDYEIHPTVEDYLNNYDRVLDFIIKLIEGKRKEKR